MHLTEARLAEADLTADERAHLQSCVRCRLAARRLNTFLDDTPTSILSQEAQRFTVVRSLGVGGMSQVVLSVDSRLGREVARKKLRTVTSVRDVERFVREANITARLEHPNIVPVYDLEVDSEGSPTLTMRVVRGRSLGEAMRTGAFRDRRARLDVFLKVCDAIAFAHSRGVVHRDLKPDNVMVGEFGEVQVVDFGLAAQETTEEVDATSGSSAGLTRSGTVMGTPAYMSPEQARGEIERVGPASDIYGLGATLWEIASGRPPFVGEADAVVAEVARGRVPSPRDVDPSVPKDLAAIVLRAMATDPSDRYPDVAALRRDVASFLAHAPVSARVPTMVDRLAKWFARNRATVMPVAATAVLALLVLIAGLVASVKAARTAEASATELAAERRAELASNYVAWGRQAWIDGDRFGALSSFAEALLLSEDDERAARLARIRIAAAQQALPRLVGLFPTDLNSGAALSPDARTAVTVERHGLAPGEEMTDAASTVRLWDLDTAREVASAQVDGRGWGVRFSPDGGTIAVVSESAPLPGTIDDRYTVLTLYDEHLRLLHGPYATSDVSACWLRRVGFTDGGRVAFVRDSCGYSFGAWNVDDGAPVLLARDDAGGARPCGASIDGSKVLMCENLKDDHEHGVLWLQDRHTTRRLGPGIAASQLRSDWEAAPSAEVVAAALQERGASLLDTRSGAVLSAVLGHRSIILRAMFSNDGTRLATGSEDGTARVADTRNGALLSPPLWHRAWVQVLGFSEDGTALITSGWDRLAHVWDLRARGRPAGAPSDAVTIGISMDNVTVLARENGSVALYSAETGERKGLPFLIDNPNSGYAFVVGDDRGLLREGDRFVLVDFTSGKVVSSYPCSGEGGCAAAVAGSRLVVTTPAGLVLVDGATGAPIGSPMFSGSVYGLMFAPANMEILALSDSGTRLWDPVRSVAGDIDLPVMWTAAVDPSGQRIAGVEASHKTRSRADAATEVVVLDVHTGSQVGPPLVHPAGVADVAWSPDGTRVVTGSEDGTVRVWDVATSSQILGPLPVAGLAEEVAFTDNGQFVVAQGVMEPHAAVFDAQTGELVMMSDDSVWSRPLRRPDRTWSVWGVEPDPRPAGDIRDAAAVMAAQHHLPSGWVPLPQEEALATWRRLRELYPEDFAP